MEVSQGILLPVLLAAIVANTAILVLVVVVTRFGRREHAARRGTSPSFEGHLMSNSFVDHGTQSPWDQQETEDRRHAYDDESDDVAGHVETAVLESDPVVEGGRAGIPAHLDDADTEADDEADAESGADVLTGLFNQPAFLRLVLIEDVRMRRYHRPATVVMFDLDGLDRLVDRLGPGAAERVVPALADTIRRLARETDHVARLAPGRFAVLLPETDEVAAINYVERVRRACELWLESGAIALRLAVGWAGTTGDPTLSDAMRLATDRMYVELRRSARRPTDAAAG